VRIAESLARAGGAIRSWMSHPKRRLAGWKRGEREEEERERRREEEEREEEKVDDAYQSIEPHKKQNLGQTVKLPFVDV
jgi:hypothetical protein